MSQGLKTMDEAGNKYKQPIFVAGLDRSGTSLIYAFLSSHPNISMVRRTNMFRYFYERYGDLSEPANFESCLDRMIHYKRIVKLNPDPDRIRKDFQAGEKTYGRLFALFHEHNAGRAGKHRWGDKSLYIERFMQNIFKEYPDAIILHMMRDPRDRYTSVKKRYKADKGRVGAATGKWRYSSLLAKRNQEKFPKNYFVVTYESLVERPEETLRQICDFIGEEFTPEMLSMRGAPTLREMGGNSSFDRFEPGEISTKSVGRYLSALTSFEILFIQRYSSRLMQAYGYTREEVNLSFRERVRFELIDHPINLARMVSWLIREYFRDRAGRELPERRMIRPLDSPETAG